MVNGNYWETPKFKRLLIETSKILQKFYSFREIADLFYRAGVISSPEKPWPSYDGSKYDYAMEKLAGAKDTRVFFREILPEIFAWIDAEYSESETGILVWSAKQVGYKVGKVERIYDLPDGDTAEIEYRDLIPPSELSEEPQVPNASQQLIAHAPEYPRQIKDLLKQLNVNIQAESWDGAALIIRRIIFLSSVIFAQQQKFHDELLENGDYKDLTKILGIVANKSPDVSAPLLSRIQAAKWMGDYANHNRNWTATNIEVNTGLVSLRAFLAALFHDPS